jgi:hypothetical protein
MFDMDIFLFFWICAKKNLHYGVAEAACNSYILDINILFSIKNKYVHTFF